ncbi:MAG: M15 family metallopeptidase [bacterium]|nr:M15 family metallopeptidase [bacterium]
MNFTDDIKSYQCKFTISPITPEIRQRIWNISYKANSDISLDELSYLTIPYVNFLNEICIGELIVNSRIANDTLNAFKELFSIAYPIEKMVLIDAYGADDILSMTDNNSSAFNYRYIDSTTILSNHSKGLALDINPLYNPYIKTVNGKERILPPEGACYADRTQDHPYYIKKNDACYKIFLKYGFTWGGDWTHSKDYQHFEHI